MNFSIFLLGSLVTFIPVPLDFYWSGHVTGLAVFALIILGFITASSFYIYAMAMKHISFLVAVVVSNSASLFTIMWAGLFLKEPITAYIIVGALSFVAGLIIMNLPTKRVALS